MVKMLNKKLVVGLEIGTTKVAALIGEILPDDMINIIGIGHSPSRGIDKGHVTDLGLLVTCVKNVINQAELMADYQISSIHLALSCKYINCQNEIGIIPITKEEVTQEDIYNVVHIAKSVRVNDEHRILHVIPQNYSIDNQEGITNPLGLSGIRMQAQVHLITCHNDIVKNIIKVIERHELKIDQLIFSGLATSYAVLTPDERELGVCVVDIGSGTMDIAIYIAGVLQYTKVIPYAGNLVTNDIAYAFNISLTDAENIKISHGCMMNSVIDKNENLEIPNIGGRTPRILQRYNLAKIIEPRYAELLNMINKEIFQLQNILHKKNLNYHLSAGVVLTGGASQIIGLIDCARQIFNTQVRIGSPLNIVGLADRVQKPYYSTVVGLLHYGKEIYKKNQIKVTKNILIDTWFKRIINWLRKEF